MGVGILDMKEWLRPLRKDESQRKRSYIDFERSIVRALQPGFVLVKKFLHLNKREGGYNVFVLWKERL